MIGGVKELRLDRKKGRGRKKERGDEEGRKETKENIIDRDSATAREAIYVRPRQTDRSPLPFP